jgi:rare lipoprotein A
MIPRPLALLLLACLVVTTAACGTRTRGEASYYGPGFAGKQTASGENFDPRAFTAAHKTLPFGTLIRVHNVDNGRTVIVRVNDRFPGTKGRVIDLSEAAFGAIAPHSQGVVRVRLEILERPDKK